MMEKWTPASVAFLAITIGLLILFIVPELQPNLPNIISEDDMTLAGYSPEGKKLFFAFDEPESPFEKYKWLGVVLTAVLSAVLKNWKKK